MPAQKLSDKKSKEIENAMKLVAHPAVSTTAPEGYKLKEALYCGYDRSIQAKIYESEGSIIIAYSGADKPRDLGAKISFLSKSFADAVIDHIDEKVTIQL